MSGVGSIERIACCHLGEDGAQAPTGIVRDDGRPVEPGHCGRDASAWVRERSGKRFDQYQSQSVDIGGRRYPFAANLLGTEVVRRAYGPPFVVRRVPLPAVAMPKSASFGATRSSSVSPEMRMLAGLMSQCTIPRAWI